MHQELGKNTLSKIFSLNTQAKSQKEFKENSEKPSAISLVIRIRASRYIQLYHHIKLSQAVGDIALTPSLYSIEEGKLSRHKPFNISAAEAKGYSEAVDLQEEVKSK